jgi:hypothetical protein
MKTCIKCQKEKDISEYYKSTKNKTGYENICKLCKNEYNNKNSKKLGQEYFNKSAKKWNDKNREKISKYNKHKYDTNKDYWLLNNDRKIYFKEWRHNNRDKLAKYGRNKYNNDINFKLSCLLRGRLYCALKTNVKTKSAIKLIGCSIEYLKQYFESQFKPEMTWSNHGEIWEIDHIKPCSSFNLADIEQQKQCFHYTNMQSLFKTTEIAEQFGYKDEIGNRNKSDKYLLI